MLAAPLVVKIGTGGLGGGGGGPDLGRGTAELLGGAGEAELEGEKSTNAGG